MGDDGGRYSFRKRKRPQQDGYRPPSIEQGHGVLLVQLMLTGNFYIAGVMRF
jgi:hypothetical protein